MKSKTESNIKFKAQTGQKTDKSSWYKSDEKENMFNKRIWLIHKMKVT